MYCLQYCDEKVVSTVEFSINFHRLSLANLQTRADPIHAKDALLKYCWGFIDGTARAISKPNRHQRVFYNGHKRAHAIKVQSVATPVGLVAFLQGPFEGRRRDSGMLRESGFL